MARIQQPGAGAAELDGAGLRIGIVQSRFNAEIGAALLGACTAALAAHGVHDADVLVVSVPGALEIPLALQRLANSRGCDALIALGAVIRGETYHFEIVANESASGVMSVQLDTGVPVANGILTCETEEQARARAADKGRDCAQVAIEMARLLRSLDDRAAH
ncbi:MAG TPA: 6,7-dimethyl-8-ribityllumazine synthase [Burkholderiales bacterium]|nr:6,7-dimethyl-8-ribityllumazine synthase [Burkholderiales bacterium]